MSFLGLKAFKTVKSFKGCWAKSAFPMHSIVWAKAYEKRWQWNFRFLIKGLCLSNSIWQPLKPITNYYTERLRRAAFKMMQSILPKIIILQYSCCLIQTGDCKLYMKLPLSSSFSIPVASMTTIVIIDTSKTLMVLPK